MYTDSLYLALLEDNCMIVFEVRKSKNGKRYVARTLMICSLQTLAATFFLGIVVLNTEDII